MDDWRFLPPEQVVSVEKEHEYFFRSIGGPIKTFRVTIVKPIPVERLHHIVPGLSCVGLGGGVVGVTVTFTKPKHLERVHDLLENVPQDT